MLLCSNLSSTGDVMIFFFLIFIITSLIIKLEL